MSDAKKYLL